MAALSDYLEAALLNHVLRNTAMTSPTTVYVALYTTDPTDADSGTEVSGGAYARQSVAFDAPAADGAGGQECLNSAEVAFPEATANWGTITHVGLRDAATGGNLLWSGALASSKTIETGDVFRFAAGDLAASLT